MEITLPREVKLLLPRYKPESLRFPGYLFIASFTSSRKISSFQKVRI